MRGACNKSMCDAAAWLQHACFQHMLSMHVWTAGFLTSPGFYSSIKDMVVSQEKGPYQCLARGEKAKIGFVKVFLGG